MAVRKPQGYYELARFVGENYGDTAELNCIPVYFPDLPEHKALLATLINLPSIKSTWFTATEVERTRLAEMWQNAYLTTLENWQNLEGCMDCGSLTECLSDPDFLAALDIAIATLLNDSTSETHAALITNVGATNNAPIGQPATSTFEQHSLVGDTNPTCDNDILYGQCLSLVQFTNRTIVDTLEDIEALSNADEFAQIIANLPVLALAAEAAGVEAVLAAIDKTLEFIAEGYAAAYDEAFETEVACALFCACVDDCNITIERFADVLHTRVSEHGYFPVTGTLIAWIEWYNAAVITGTAVADVAFWACWGAVHAMNALFFGSMNAGLDVLVQRAANNPDGDWAFCDCATTWEHDLDIAALAAWSDYAYADAGTYDSENGWGASSNSNYQADCIFGIEWAEATFIDSVDVYFTEQMNGNLKAIGWGTMPDLATQFSITQDELAETLTINQGDLTGLAIIAINNSPQNTAPFNGYIYRIVVRGEGFDPFA